MMFELINIKSHVAPGEGSLYVFETNKDIPFDIKRIYYITDVPTGITRGFHAHKQLKQLIFCANGSIEILLDDGKEKRTILLNDPGIGILITGCLWREMKWIKEGSTLVVAASEHYSEADYIRNYNDFLKYVESNKNE